jgi:coenzyme F420-dependent glucose-6-phosphate dehydrogenase
MRIGYKLCSEERDPAGLIDDARSAEAVGFDFAAISDHFHPWTDRQGQSPFVWSALGGIAAVTDRITMGTAVTCPTVRMHPALIAQAAATIACMLPGRFFLGVGTGERLNEHIFGDPWPSVSTRRAMLREAVEILRRLWTGELITYEGEYFSIDGAKIYTRPDRRIPVYLAAGGPEAASLAAEIGDGLIASGDSNGTIDAFEVEGGMGPRLAEVLVDADDDEERALARLRDRWPTPAIPGELSAELPLPRHFEQAATAVREDDLRDAAITGTDVGPYVERVNGLRTAGFTHVFFHQVGQDQERFFRFAGDLLGAVSGSVAEATVDV